MKSYKLILMYVTACAFVIIATSCESLINESPADELAPQNFLNTQDGLITVLRSAYRESTVMNGSNTNRAITGIEEFPTDIHWQLGGGAHSVDVHLNNFTWDPSTWNWNWNHYWSAIQSANIVLENVDNAKDMPSETKEVVSMEARFIRAYTYWYLYKTFGTVPLRTNTEQELALPRASEEELLNFIESELLATVAGLPEAGNELNYGRAHKMAPRAFLTEFYMMAKQWSSAADMANEIVNSGKYELYPEYSDLFKVENERNSEYIWVRTAKSDPSRTHDSEYWTVCSPTDFLRDPKTGLEMLSQWTTFASNYKLRDAFVMTFDTTKDKRFDLIMTSYINQNGEKIEALGNDDARSFKFWPSESDVGPSHGNDLPEFRYAEILLFRAEALNEMNGPNQETIDLINQIRQRAGLDDLSASDFGSKEELRDHILKERGWEFYNEGKRRNTLIRMGKFIEYAHNRGLSNAQDSHKLYPIPQFAIDANPELKQNPGY